MLASWSWKVALFSFILSRSFVESILENVFASSKTGRRRSGKNRHSGNSKVNLGFTSSSFLTHRLGNKRSLQHNPQLRDISKMDYTPQYACKSIPLLPSSCHVDFSALTIAFVTSLSVRSSSKEHRPCRCPSILCGFG